MKFPSVCFMSQLESPTKQSHVQSTWFIYIVETRYGHWYTGITTDVARRFCQHSSGKGAKALIGKGPLKLLLERQVGSKSEASKLEYQVKKLSKKQKISWVNTCLATDSLHPIEK
ncbi:GIY-YIG nuclease superfamily protein [Pseudoalteromonas sp. P1-9]|nr:GIY-YIG nuclease superfamily protein [Pseudoalteromonas sp. P1-9]